MRAEAGVLLGWAALLAVLDGGLWAYRPSLLVGLLLAGASAAALCAALLLAAARPPWPRWRAIPDVSFAAVLLAVACLGLAASGIFGLWLALVSLALGAVASLGLGRELRAARRRPP